MADKVDPTPRTSDGEPIGSNPPAPPMPTTDEPTKNAEDAQKAAENPKPTPPPSGIK